MESQPDILAAAAAVLFCWSLLARSSHLTLRLRAPESASLWLADEITVFLFTAPVHTQWHTPRCFTAFTIF